MFLITTETCRAFTFAEILIMAAMNMEAIRLDVEGGVLPKTAAERHS
jgi:hypothetical protein